MATHLATRLRDTLATAARSRETPEKFTTNPLLAAGTLKKTFVVRCARVGSDAPSVNGPERIEIAQVIECETRAEHRPSGEEQDVRRDKRMQILFVTGERRNRVEEQHESVAPSLCEPHDESAQDRQLNGANYVDYRVAHALDEVEVFHDF